MINYGIKYAGFVNAPNAAYPWASAKNSTTDTSEDGYPIEEAGVNDVIGFHSSIMAEAGDAPNGQPDSVANPQLLGALKKVINVDQRSYRQVEPLNNDYNGYLDPGHQSSLPSGAGYPGTSGSPTTYGLDNEISLGIRSGIAGNSVSSDADGWVFDGSIYKEYTFTAEQMQHIDISNVSVFVKDETGQVYFWKHGDTGVTVTEPTSTTLRVTLDAAIFGVITKLWRFFVTEKVGYVVELSPAETEFNINGFKETIVGEQGYRIYRNGKIYQWGSSVSSTNASGGGSVNYLIPFPVKAEPPVICIGDNTVISGVSVINDQVSESGFGFQHSGGAVSTRINYSVWGE